MTLPHISRERKTTLPLERPRIKGHPPGMTHTVQLAGTDGYDPSKLPGTDGLATPSKLPFVQMRRDQGTHNTHVNITGDNLTTDNTIDGTP